MTNLARISDLIIGRPLLVLPQKLGLIAQLLAGRIGIEAFEEPPSGLSEEALAVLRYGPQASRFVGSSVDSGQRLPFMRTPEGVGIVTITGSLVNRGAWIGPNMSGMTSYEGIAAQLKAALADPKTNAILLDLESPGGQGMGAFSMARAVRAAREVKPVLAVVNGMAASAAYAIASNATRVVTAPDGMSGSIGVVMLHADFSRALDREGVTPTFVFAGDHKIDGNPYEPLSREVKADLQAEIDAMYEQFTQVVGEGRGRKMSAKAARDTAARIFTGQAAVDIGLADEVATFDEALDTATRLGRGQTRFSRSSGATAAPPIDPRRVQAGADACAAEILARRASLQSRETIKMTATPQTHIGNDWDGVIAGINAQNVRNAGRAPAGQVSPASAAPAPRQAPVGASASPPAAQRAQQVAAPWADVVAELNAEMGAKAKGQPAGSTDDGWADIATKLNREAGLEGPGARRREAVR